MSNGQRSSRILQNVIRIGAFAVLVAALSAPASAQAPAAVQLVARSAAVPAPAPARAVTFAKDVAPILQNHCQVCHQVGSIGPMPLMTYEEVRPFAALISQRVQARTMPPWHMDKTVGIQEFKNDISLSDAEIKTLVDWAASGTPMGDPKELPAPVAWPDETEWRHASRMGRAPDLVLKSAPYTVPAHGQDAWWRPVTETGITEPRWVQAVEVKPSYPRGRRVTHHTLVTLLQEEQGITGLASTAVGDVNSAGLLTEWAIGKVGELYPENTGKLLLPGSRIRWEVHYWPAGEQVVEDQVTLAIWFYPKEQEPKYRTILNLWNVAPAARMEIQPRSVAVHQSTVVLRSPARLESFQPHMHMRGKAMSMEAIYPDGRKELLNMVSNFQWKWHINYLYKEDAAPLLPEGTVLLLTSWHDNTTANPNNPDPDQYLTWGDRTVDEMAHAWVGVTYLEQEDFDRMVAERAQRTRARATQASGEEEHIHPE